MDDKCVKQFNYKKIKNSPLIIIIHPNASRAINIIKKIKRNHIFHGGHIFTCDPIKYGSLFDAKDGYCYNAEACNTDYLEDLFLQQGGKFPSEISSEEYEILSRLDEDSKQKYMKNLDPLHFLPNRIFGDAIPKDLYDNINRFLFIRDAYIILHHLFDNDNDNNNIGGSTSNNISNNIGSSSGNGSDNDGSDSDGSDNDCSDSDGSGSDNDGSNNDFGDYNKTKCLKDNKDNKDNKELKTELKGNYKIVDDGVGGAKKFWKQTWLTRCLTNLKPENSLSRIISVASTKQLTPKILTSADLIFIFSRNKDELKDLFKRAKLNLCFENFASFYQIMSELDNTWGLVVERENIIIKDGKTGARKVFQKMILHWTTDIIRS